MSVFQKELDLSCQHTWIDSTWNTLSALHLSVKVFMCRWKTEDPTAAHANAWLHSGLWRNLKQIFITVVFRKKEERLWRRSKRDRNNWSCSVAWSRLRYFCFPTLEANLIWSTYRTVVVRQPSNGPRSMLSFKTPGEICQTWSRLPKDSDTEWKRFLKQNRECRVKKKTSCTKWLHQNANKDQNFSIIRCLHY